MQKFTELPFTVVLHWGYGEQTTVWETASDADDARNLAVARFEGNPIALAVFHGHNVNLIEGL